MVCLGMRLMTGEGATWTGVAREKERKRVRTKAQQAEADMVGVRHMMKEGGCCSLTRYDGLEC